MNPPAVIFTLLAGVLVFGLPRKWAAAPLIIGATYVSWDSSIDFAGLHFTASRMLLIIGILRVLIKGEQIAGGLNKLDRVMIAWGAWTACSSGFHEDIFGALVFRLGMVLDLLGFYFLIRVFVQDQESFLRLCRIIIIALVPIALEMMSEAKTGRNMFSLLGCRFEFSDIRGGKIRAQGPFGHSILAGTVGAVCFPLALLFWKSNRPLALLGVVSCLSIVVTSRSSGPVMTAIFVVIGLCLWKFRKYMSLIRWSAVLGVLVLAMVMNAPVYYILDRIDITGHSTGWHRAALIQGAITHVDDWWLGGTDYTRDWTPEAGYDKNNTDITNHYIRMAVWGGLPMLLLFFWTLVLGFKFVSKALRANTNAPFQMQFMLWTMGCILFGHVTAMVSVSYFDQSVFFLYLVLAAVATFHAAPVVEAELGHEPAVNGPLGGEADFCHHR